MTTEIPRRNAARCLFMLAPPMMLTEGILFLGSNICKFSAIWEASSRVGARIKARVPPHGLAESLCSIGNRNAAVLPVPVAAQPIKSEPLKMTGIACRWIGVGSLNPRDAHLCAREACNPISVKIIIFLPAAPQIVIRGAPDLSQTKRLRLYVTLP